jgi:hypothetical protein
MVDVPAAIPVIVPVLPDPNMVTGPAEGETVQVPPADALVSVVTEPMQI